MGLAIDRENFTAEEFEQFSERLYACLAVLKQQIRQADFGRGVFHIGAELENYIVDDAGEVMPINTEIIEHAHRPEFTVELNRFNLEINLPPIPVQARVFSALQAEIERYLNILRHSAQEFGAHIIPTGILPTLRNEHLTAEYMTDKTRYRALSKYLYAMRGEDFKVHICGDDELLLSRNNVALEGANTSFQYHLMITPEAFADCFNAAQLITPLMVAIAANSPLLLGKVLWDETRIALFKQSIDSRGRNNSNWRHPARVFFGHGWVRQDAWELFAETVALYPPIFPILSKEDPLATLGSEQAPKLEELCLHMGTTWPWNRPVYAAADGGHVRIEMRALPAGPSTIDMCANAAFATGLVHGLSDSMEDFLAVMPFRFSEYNFYRAAQKGLDASIIWANPAKHQPCEMPILDVIRALLPIAESGLQKIGIAREEIRHYLGVIDQRIEKKITGARWQKQVLAKFEGKMGREKACARMFERYVDAQKSGLPVSEWTLS